MVLLNVCAWARESMWEATASDSLLAIYGTAIKQMVLERFGGSYGAKVRFSMQ